MGTQMAGHSAEDSAGGVGTDPVVPVGPRKCGRCQRPFEGDTASFVQTDWALCPACEEILLPGRQGSRSPAPDA